MGQTELVQTQLLIPKDRVMDNFCYAFTKALLTKLKSLIEEDRVFERGLTEAKTRESWPSTSSITTMAKAVIRHLEDQSNVIFHNETPKGLEKFVGLIEEFLAVFEAQ